MNNNIIDVNETDFETKVLEESVNKLIVVDFWAPWCGPCKQLTPILEKVISSSPDKIILAKVNIDEIFVDSSNTPSIPLSPSKKESKSIGAISRNNWPC